MSASKRATIRIPRDYTVQSIKNAYEDFIRRLARLRVLDLAYYTGQGPDGPHKVVVNYCKYISDTKTSYVAGLPPVYDVKADNAAEVAIKDAFLAQDKERVDQDLVFDASRYGRAFEIVYLDETMTPQSDTVSPLDAFVAYDESLHPKPVVAAIHYVERRDDKTLVHFLDVYDDAEVVRYRITGETDDEAWQEVPGTRKPHGFDGVPIIEYRNNSECMGDYESVLPLQDALNEVMSDRVKDKTRFADAMLVGKGFTFGDSDDELDDYLSRLKDYQMLSIPRDADISYLVKTMDESGVQVLVDDIMDKIRMSSGVPNLSDESFAANSSGVAMKYKLLGLNNLAQSLETEFAAGFRKRCELYRQTLPGAQGAVLDEMSVTFKFNCPEDDSYSAGVLTSLLQAGIISRRTAMANCAYVDDPDLELERIAQEEGEDPYQQSLMADLDGILNQLPPAEESVEETVPIGEPEERWRTPPPSSARWTRSTARRSTPRARPVR